MYTKLLTIAALILTPMTQRDTVPVSTTKPPLPDKNAAVVESVENVLIFTDSKPVRKYKYLGVVKATFALNGQYQNLRKILLKKAKSDFPEIEGLIIRPNNGGSDAGEAIRFLDE